MSPIIRISYFFLIVGLGNLKPPITIVGISLIELILFTWGCFFGKCIVWSLPLGWKVTLPLLQSITAHAYSKRFYQGWSTYCHVRATNPWVCCQTMHMHENQITAPRLEWSTRNQFFKGPTCSARRSRLTRETRNNQRVNLPCREREPCEGCIARKQVSRPSRQVCRGLQRENTPPIHLTVTQVIN